MSDGPSDHHPGENQHPGDPDRFGELAEGPRAGVSSDPASRGDSFAREPHPDWPTHQTGRPYPDAVLGAAPSLLPPGWSPTAPRREPTLPTEPADYYQFYRTPALRWWKVALALVVAIIASFFLILLIGTAGFVIDLATGRTSFDDLTLATEFTPAVFTANNLALASLIGVVVLCQLVFFGQRPRWLNSVDGRLHWGWLARCLGVAFLAYGLFTALPWFIAPPLFGNDPEFWVFLILMVLTTPLQAAAEEYVFRGFLPRAVAVLFPFPPTAGMLIGWVVSSVVFMLMHAAGEPVLNVYYFIFGMLMCLLVWRTGGLAAAIAIHVANNVTAFLVTIYAGEMDSVFQREAGSAGIADILPTTILIAALTAILIWWARRRGMNRVAAPAARRRAAGAAVEPPRGVHEPSRAIP